MATPEEMDEHCMEIKKMHTLIMESVPAAILQQAANNNNNNNNSDKENEHVTSSDEESVDLARVI
jgi:hypothetical protein